MPEKITPPLIVLLTDFGLADWFVGVMHAEIFSRAPRARVIDLSHAVPPGHVAAGAFALAAALPSLPPGTIVCAVVDPGVGTPRRAMCGRIGKYFWSGPDNGLASPLLSTSETGFDLFAIDNPAWRKAAASHTFHGRDLFAPAAAQLALGADPSTAGPPIADLLTLAPSPPEATSPGQWRGEVVWIDHFGNCLTNFDRATFGPLLQTDFLLKLHNIEIKCLTSSFGATPPAASLAYWGSAGCLEIGINLGSAARETGAKIGASVLLDLPGPPRR